MANEIDNTIGFQTDPINLSSMEDIVVKLMFIGDGMSGKTQILITFANLLLEYLHRIYSLSVKSEKSDSLHEESLINEMKKESNILTPDFYNWVKRYGFFLRYGNIMWDIKTVSLDTETVGLEDFEYVFPYTRNDTTYKIRFIGNDVGGQNIFDHFRDVLAKMAGPDDNLIVVFDKSRELSCYNSIEQIKKVLNVVEKQDEERSFLSRIIYCGNKSDLEKHIQNQKWREGVLESTMGKIVDVINNRKGEYSFPSLIGVEQKERILKYKIENNQITFPDLEAIIYNAIKESDNAYNTKLMSEINTKALCREIAAQLVYNQKVTDVDEESLQAEQIWEDFRDLLFQNRPLAVQYLGGIKRIQQDDESTYFGRVRDRWRKFGLDLPITAEDIRFALHRTANAEELLSEMGDRFDTNALSGDGILKLMDFIIQERFSKLEDLTQKEKRRIMKRKLERF
ncbi:MAG: hypothetical protein ACFFAE_06565 [Candidatus Hodarchaeota archaeon]